jgi:hypothetical protein
MIELYCNIVYLFKNFYLVCSSFSNFNNFNMMTTFRAGIA